MRLETKGFIPFSRQNRVEKKVTCTLNLFFNSKPITIVGSGDTEKIAKKKCPVTIARSAPKFKHEMRAQEASPASMQSETASEIRLNNEILPITPAALTTLILVLKKLSKNPLKSKLKIEDALEALSKSTHEMTAEEVSPASMQIGTAVRETKLDEEFCLSSQTH